MQAVIDLRNNVLVIGDVSTRFLDESELPEHARLNQPHDEDRQLDDALRRSQEEASSSQSWYILDSLRTIKLATVERLIYFTSNTVYLNSYYC